MSSKFGWVDHVHTLVLLMYLVLCACTCATAGGSSEMGGLLLTSEIRRPSADPERLMGYVVFLLPIMLLLLGGGVKGVFPNIQPS